MIVKRTSRYQLTLPTAVVGRFPGVRHFEIQVEDGCIVLVPANVSSIDSTWSKLEALGIREKDVENAVNWAREAKNPR